MTTLKKFVQSVVDGEVVEPFWLRNEATSKDEMNGRYREIVDYFGTFDSVQYGLKVLVEVCTNEDCPGTTTVDGEGKEVVSPGSVRSVVSRVPGAFRLDSCCLVCGESQTHRAGWTDTKAREGYRASIGSREVG